MTRVSESPSNPSARRCCSEPSAPAARKSEKRWSTATLATPKARDSLKHACNQWAMARLDRMAHASSTTTRRWPPSLAGQHRLQPCGGAGHQDPEGG